MIQKSPAHDVPFALVPAIFLLCATWVDAAATASVCQRCPIDPHLLDRMKLQVMWNQRTARELYVSYVTHMGLLKDAPVLCKATPVPWFPDGNITTKPDGAMLENLYGTLKRMDDALALIQEQQKLNNPDCPLCGELEKASLAVTGLLQNAQCALCRQGLAPATIPPLQRTRSESLFHQKTEGCRVLWGYTKFIARLAKGFKRQLKKAKKPGRQKKRSGRSQTAHFGLTH